MAILKHTTSKNANYNDALFYLLFEHDDNSMKPVLDENGKMIRRRGYILDGINCDPFTYAEECRELNELYHKNQTPGEIKAHHYIISFDPQDQIDRGLTPERAQTIGIEYAKKNFPATRHWSVHTRMEATEAGISMYILSSTVCANWTWNRKSLWSVPATAGLATSTTRPEIT